MANNKPKIKIKKKNKGTFTRYCKSKGYKGVTQKCIQEGKKSRNSKTRKRANFAQNFGKRKRK